MQNSPLLIENMERKSKLMQGDSGDVDTLIKGTKDAGAAVPTLNTLQNSQR